MLIMDGSQVGRGCMALMLSVLLEQEGQRRALPLCWLVLKANKGHFKEERHQELVAQAQELIAQAQKLIAQAQKLIAQAQKLIAPEREVVFLGDGEFDGPGLLAALTQAGWHYVCRTARNVRLAEADWAGETFSLADLGLQPGDCVEMADVLFTAQGFGPVLVGAVWERGQREPLILVTDLDFLCEARLWYSKRFGIETLFSDQKSRGFYLCHSHLSDPERLSRLLMATCLAYYWMVCLGAEVVRRDWQAIIHRAKRCDLSLFQMGLVWLEHCLNEGWAVPVRLQIRPIK